MFTGLIQQKARIEAVDVSEQGARIHVAAKPYDEPWAVGESIAIDGVCLTLVGHTATTLWFDVLQETLRLTQLHAKQPGDAVNMERALRINDRLGGHLVAGHVDGVGTVASITPVGRDWAFTLQCDRALCAQMIHKGSISVNGVSLTLTEVTDTTFSVHLIPVTMAETNLSDVREGQGVNIEVDPLAKYVKRQFESGTIPRRVEWDAFKQGLKA